VSQQNLERVQRLYDYLNQGDLDAALAVLDPGVEWWTRWDTPDTAIVKGRERWGTRWAEITGVLEEFHQEPTQVIDAGEYVVVCVHQVARTRGVLIDQHEVHVFRLRDGLVIELREFHEKHEALEAIGQEG
jgi:ketosteroid isomerase-like protein